MIKHIFVLTVIICLSTDLIYSINHLDIMTSMQGAHNGSYFGYSIATLDFNHDGFDDLIVCSPEWKSVYPDPVNWPKGRVDIYFGGQNFDNIPDITLLGQYDFQYMKVDNIGDINGDGFDDLYIRGKEQPGNIGTPYLRIYTGSNTVPIEPVVLIPYSLPTGRTLYQVVQLGDVNGDGYDDIGFSIDSSTIPGALIYNIVWGNSLVAEYITTSCAYTVSHTYGFSGIGDINNDGYDDFAIGYTYDDPYLGYHLITIYYGNAAGTFDDQIVLTQTQSGISKICIPLGDINGDGIDDFMGYQSFAGLNVWFGATVIDTNPNIMLTPAFQGGEDGLGLKHGDINNDGYQDIVGTDYFDNEFCVWMGRPFINGVNDLIVYCPGIPSNPLDYFGYALTMGDYNADGCSDVAISAPFTDNTLLPDYRGYVYIYAGNTDFVSNDDPSSPVLPNQFCFSVYPNPARVHDNFVTLKIKNIRDNINPVEISIFNIRGQCVQHNQMSQSLFSTQYYLDVSKLNSGIYICKVRVGSHFDLHKISIIK